MYKCPVCQKQLNLKLKQYQCEHNHSFDISRFGYVNLYRTNKPSHGDNIELVQARSAFLHGDYYKPLRDEMNRLIFELKPSCLIDLGCGEGYYTNSYQALSVIGFDLSKKAIEQASKAKHFPFTHYAISSIFDLPLFDNTVDVATLIFAPLPKEELRRVLKKGGHLIEVTPNTHHLFELKQVLYPDIILNKTLIHEDLTLIKSQNIEYSISLSQEMLQNLFKMTPYSYKTSLEATQRLQKVRKLDITISFLIRVYQFN